MANFQPSVATSSKNDPAATDLDYYSKPENYTGSTLQSLQRFKADKTKEDLANKKVEKTRRVKDAKYYFFHRYKHILKDVIFIDDLVKSDQDEEEEDEREGDLETVEEGEDERADKPDLKVTPDEPLQPVAEEVDVSGTLIKIYTL